MAEGRNILGRLLEELRDEMIRGDDDEEYSAAIPFFDTDAIPKVTLNQLIVDGTTRRRTMAAIIKNDITIPRRVRGDVIDGVLVSVEHLGGIIADTYQVDPSFALAIGTLYWPVPS